MNRVGQRIWLVLDFFGFILKLLAAFALGDLADMFSRGGRIWLIPMVLGFAGLMYALIRLGTP